MTKISRTRILERWLAEHGALVAHLVRLYAADAADAEDLRQEILIALWQSADRFRGDAKESTWIYRVGLHVALGRRRKAATRPRAVALEEATAVADGSATPEQRLRLQRALSAIRSLPPVDRAVVLLALEGFSHREISQVLGMSENLVAVRLHRTRRRLGSEEDRS